MTTGQEEISESETESSESSVEDIEQLKKEIMEEFRSQMILIY